MPAVTLEHSGRRQGYVGYRLSGCKRGVFRNCDWIYGGVRGTGHEGETRMIETSMLGLVTVLLLVYLVYALLRPEKF
jgi:K+-transporting ATPase KdpF subunit